MTEPTPWDLTCTCRGWVHARQANCRPVHLSDDLVQVLRERLPKIAEACRQAMKRGR